MSITDTATEPVAEAGFGRPDGTAGPRITLGLLRAVATAQLVAILVQPVLAGLYLSGEFDALGLHSANAVFLHLTALLVLAAGLVYWLGGGGRARVPAVAAVGLVGITLQAGFGYARELALHIPLGVLVVLASVLATLWVWGAGSRVPRRGVRNGARS